MAKLNLRIVKSALGALLVMALPGTLCGCAGRGYKPLPTVESVDIGRYMGTWYEIARLPNRFEAKCAGNVMAHYTLVGEPSRTYAWILARDTSLPKSRLDILLARAAELGFDQKAFIFTPHDTTQPTP